jgi:putative hydrolase of the HAD superfamily
LRDRHGWAVEQREFLAARRQATQVDPAMLRLCRALAPQTALAVFTNNGGWFSGFAEQIVPELLPLFGGRLVCSGSLRLLKPAPESYRACLHRLGAAAETTLFVDDRADNVEGARAAGLDALMHVDVASLRAALIDRGFNPGEDHAS